MDQSPLSRAPTTFAHCVSANQPDGRGRGTGSGDGTGRDTPGSRRCPAEPPPAADADAGPVDLEEAASADAGSSSGSSSPGPKRPMATLAPGGVPPGVEPDGDVELDGPVRLAGLAAGDGPFNTGR